MRALLIALALFFSTSIANADETGSAGITIDLNTLQPVEGGCQLTFVASTAHADGIEKLVFEMVLFTTEGALQTLAVPGGRCRTTPRADASRAGVGRGR